MYFYLPIALTSISLPLIVGLGLLVGLLSGLFGVGGGFLMTPLLIMIGIPPTVAAASDSLQIVGASTTGTFAHWRLGNVDFKMGVYLLIGGFIGGLGGVRLIEMLRMMGNADFVIKVTYVLMLGIVGTYMFFESLNSLKKAKHTEHITQAAETSSVPKKESGFVRFLKSLPLQTRFEKSGVTHSALLVIVLGGFVGVLAAIMGVGGGFLMVPVMVYLLRMPMHVVVGTSLFQILFTCIEVSFLQAYVNHTVDFVLAVLLLLGSTFGAQIGTKLGRKLHGDQLKILLAAIVLIVTVKILLDLLLEPSLLLSLKGGH
ncbi:MAG TPA: sulfite exporter TauE/SafE family protein [Nitrospirae bacterium]|nr:sulfite exporter TauE/SafE family protein [Nitrospirota bacterium]